jgi:hypoxanthine-guanine phosphoribosyltransferase
VKIRLLLGVRGYIGMTIPDEFVAGYGLDHAQRYRQLHEVRILPRQARRGQSSSD